MKLTEETIHGIASEHWITIVNPTRYALASTDFARAIESTVRQQDAELVRELVEALQRVTTGSRMEGESEYRVAASSFRFADAALTRAQQWMDNA